MKEWFKNIENDRTGSVYPLGKVIEQLNFNEQGLIPVIAQDAQSKDVLMFAWMNRESLQETLQTGQVCYWSRSRQALWRKGESSGHVQALKELRADCDGDVLLASIEQKGAACHTLRRSCFYLRFGEEELVIDPVETKSTD